MYIRKGYPIAGTPLATDDLKRVYMSTMDALAFGHHGHGITFADYANHFVMVFDLTSTQQASHDFLYPELTNGAISLELKVSAALAVNTRCFCLAKKHQQFTLTLIEKSPNVMLNPTT